MEISPAAVGAGCAVMSLVGGGAVAWVRESLANVKATQKTLFEKLDDARDEVADYKLHVAEHYVNKANLKEMLEPLTAQITRMENDIREELRKRP